MFVKVKWQSPNHKQTNYNMGWYQVSHLYNKGPNMVPCGTQLVTFTGTDVKPLQTTLW